MIRIGTPEDAQDIFDLTVEFIEESPFKDSLNQDQLWTKVEHFLTPAREKHIIFVWEDLGEIVGYLAGIITEEEHMFSSDKTAMELAWFVNKDHRKGSGGMRLLRAYESWAQMEGCKHIMVSNLNISNNQRLTKLYQKLGYNLVEQTFSKDI